MSERKPHVVVVGGGLVSLLLYYMTQFNAFVSMISYSAVLWYIIGELAINAIYVNTRMVLDIVKVLKYTYTDIVRFFEKYCL